MCSGVGDWIDLDALQCSHRAGALVAPLPPLIPSQLHIHLSGHHCTQQVNYNLMTVNAVMAVTGLYQLSRKIRCVAPILLALSLSWSSAY